jgi:uncharacterized protein YqjF (DUF2071 family)
MRRVRAYPVGDFDSAVVNVVAHRPWKIPERRWVMTQTWHDLLFAHWHVPPRELSDKVPPEFELDLFDGDAWIGIVPFYMTNVAPRGIASLPWVSEFPELNVRTYVSVGGKPGVYFFSLDAGRALAVHAARALLNLPYFTATMTIAHEGGTIRYDSYRSGRQRTAAFAASYEPAGEVFTPLKGSLEYFLTERYCLYHRSHRRVPYRLEIHHRPWALQPARGELTWNGLALANGLRLPASAPLLHFSQRQDTLAWAPTALAIEREPSPTW